MVDEPEVTAILREHAGLQILVPVPDVRRDAAGDGPAGRNEGCGAKRLHAPDPIRSENRIKAKNDCNGRRPPRGQLLSSPILSYPLVVTNFGRLALGCIEADVRKQILILQHFKLFQEI